MLELEMQQQLKELFSGLNKDIFLRLYGHGQPKFLELQEMANDIAQTSAKIVVKTEETKAMPLSGVGISIETAEFKGIHFGGIPGGHEFSSLILAILDLGGKARRLDEALALQIESLKGPINLTTFVSLSCENCPDVVQALNKFALIHPNFVHTMVDGDLAQEEVKRRAIGAVPAVYAGDKLLFSGRMDLPSIIEKLEAHFGKKEMKSMPCKDLGKFEVLVLGGGPAGVAAAIYSARKGLKTGIIAERLGGQVKDTKGIENFIATPYTEGHLLTDNLREHLSKYDIAIFEHRRITEIGLEDDSKTVRLNTNEMAQFEKMIFATGAKWRELNVPGEKEYLGKGVAFCPHCDGPLYKNKNIVVIGGGNSGVEAAIDLAGIGKNITVVEFASQLKADEILLKKLSSLPNISVLTNIETLEILGDGEKVVGLKILNRVTNEVAEIAVDGVFVQIGLLPNSQVLQGKVATNKFGEIVIDIKCRTTAPGVYAAGDVTNTPYKQIVISMGEGAKAALAAFEDRMLGR